MQLAEKYRPRDWGEVIGQEKIVKRLRMLTARPDWDRDAWILSGPSGAGKTSLALLVAGKLAKHEFDLTELDGENCTVQNVRELTDRWQYCPWGGGWRVVVVNEYHCMTPKAVQVWLTALERIPRRTLVIFTSTKDEADLFGEFAGPFASRCKCFALTNQGLAQKFAERAREIADREGLNGAPAKAYLRLVQEKHNNFRAVLQAVEAGEMIE